MTPWRWILIGMTGASVLPLLWAVLRMGKILEPEDMPPDQRWRILATGLRWMAAFELLVGITLATMGTNWASAVTVWGMGLFLWLTSFTFRQGRLARWLLPHVPVIGVLLTLAVKARESSDRRS
jgi:hypothetical protein